MVALNTARAEGVEPRLFSIHEVQKILGSWRGSELPALQSAALSIGHLVKAGVLTFMAARETLTQSAQTRGYFERFDSTEVVECIEYSLHSGQFSFAHANDNHTSQTATVFKSDSKLCDLTNPGGFISDVVDWIVSSSSRPSRELALAATIPFVGALIGRRFASPTDLRTNFYTVGLAGSGFGKDHARTQLKRLITAADLSSCSGPGRFMSATALRRLAMQKPSCFCLVDEFGGMMRQITDRKAGIHNLLIRSDLLEIFSSTATYFEGAEYADTPAKKIYNPNLCLYGTSTPDDFWGSVSSLNTTDGLLPRFLLFDLKGPKPKRVKPERAVTEIPASLIAQCKLLTMAGRNPDINFSNTSVGDMKYPAIVVQYAKEAKAELARFEEEIESKEASTTKESAPILNRAVEHAIKLALTASVATNSNDPVITGHAIKWAIQLAWHSTCTMIEETRDRISDNAREAELKRIYSHIKNAAGDGITEGNIADRCQSIESKRRNELLSDLILAGRIEERITPTRGRSKKRFYFLS